MKTNEILKIFGTDFKAMTKTLLASADLASLIPSKDACIGIKPNLVAPTPAATGATTHPEIVASIIEYLREHDFENIVITEGCWIAQETEACLKETGFKALCEAYDIPFWDVRKASSHAVDCGGMTLNISDVVQDIDFLINVPVLKGHCQVKMTCALKNIKGLVPDSEKRRFHALGIQKPLGHLAAGIHQDFIVVDHICGDLEFEDGGNPFRRNCIMAARDPVLVDAYVCDLLGLTLEEVPYIQIAQRLGVGTTDLSKAEIIALNQSDDDTPLPRGTRVLDVAYAAEALDACSACYAAMIPALIRLSEEHLLEKLDTKIAMGQDHRGKTGKLGVGACTAAFDTCIMGCPPKTDAIYEGLKNYILEL